VQRDQLRKYISNNLSNEALARKFGVHIRTIEKIVQGQTWIHCSN
jgi:plasmid maintenance system antidote protein VapI